MGNLSFDMDLRGNAFFKQVCEFADLPVDDIVAEVIDNERFRHYLAETCANAYHKDFTWFGGHKDVDPCYRCEDFESWTYEDCDNFANKVADGSIRYWAPIILKTLKARMSMPSEVKAREEEEKAEKALADSEFEKQKKLNWKVFQESIPKLYRDASIKDYPKPFMDGVIKPILESGLSAILYGGNGVGKTHLAYALMKEWKHEGTVSAYSNLTVFMSLLSQMAVNSKKSAIEFIEQRYVKQCAVLVLDECDKTDMDGIVFRNFSHLINRRYEEGKQTLLLCNAKNEAELEQKLTSSVVSRFKSDAWVAKIICLGDTDKRNKKPPTQGDLL